MKKVNKNKLALSNPNLFTLKSTQYSLLAGAFLLGVPACDDDDDPLEPIPSTVEYTDVDPDEVVQNLIPENFDINNDGVEDFTLQAYAIPYTFSYYGFPLAGTIGIMGVTPINGAEVAGSLEYLSGLGTSYPVASNLDAGVTVGSKLNFDTASNAMAIKINIGGLLSVSYGNWLGPQTDKFLGLKIYDNGNAHYGWMRLDTDDNLSNPSLTVKDYAYETAAGDPIVTEAVMRSLINTEEINVYSFNKTLQINSKKENANVRVLKNGKEILKDVLKNHNFKATLNEATGLHSVEITIDGETITKEIKF